MASFRRMDSVRRLEQIRKESTGPVSYTQKILLCCMGGGTIGLMCAVFILAIGLLGLNIAKIALGAIHLDSCPAQPLVPIYLIVGGVISLVMNCSCRPSKDESGQFKVACQGCGMVVGLLIGIFSLCWLITGTVFVVQTRNAVGTCTYTPETTNITTSSTSLTFQTSSELATSSIPTPSAMTDCPRCEEVLLTFAFAIVLLEWSFVILLILFSCCICCLPFCLKRCAPTPDV